LQQQRRLLNPTRSLHNIKFAREVYMHPSDTFRSLHWSLLIGGLTAASLLATQVHAQPSNKPLLALQAGAKPNLMIALDNSGSMAYPFQETYGLEVSTNAATGLLRCPLPFYANQAGAGWVLGGRVDQFRPNGQRCIQVTAFDANQPEIL
jgi:hypothetical protein